MTKINDKKDKELKVMTKKVKRSKTKKIED